MKALLTTIILLSFNSAFAGDKNQSFGIQQVESAFTVKTTGSKWDPNNSLVSNLNCPDKVENGISLGYSPDTNGVFGSNGKKSSH